MSKTRSINKIQFLEIISAKTGIDLKNTSFITDLLMDIVMDNLHSDSFSVRLFGSLKVVAPITRKDGKVSKWKIKFKPNKKFKSALQSSHKLQSSVIKIGETHKKLIPPIVSKAEKSKRDENVADWTNNSSTPVLIFENGPEKGLNDGDRVDINTIINGYS